MATLVERKTYWDDLETAATTACAETVKDDSALTSMQALCDYIVERHHTYLRQEMPRLGTLLFRIAEVECEAHPELRRLLEIYGNFSGDLKRHIDVEEEVLFPMIRELEAGEFAATGTPGRIELLTEDLANEHEISEATLREVRALTRDFHVPDDACDSYKLVLAQLADFERNMLEHLGIENNILFPKACQAERAIG